ncbi:MAG: transaldolase [Actinomycetes bacterium]|jgi:transaldolase
MTDRLKELSNVGVSIWLDDLSRDRLASGNLAQMLVDDHIVGVTTNPSIFDKAISGHSDAYDQQIADAKARSLSVDEAIRTMTTYDVRWACDVLRDVYDQTKGFDGRVSIEVDPRMARETAATIAEARALHWTVDRENVLIKIPATVEGLPAITATIAAGISVNVTLIFSVERYEHVIDAWLAGLEQANADGLDLSKIHSVASFFVSRVDTTIDKALAEIATDQAMALEGAAGIANARLAWVAYEKMLKTDRWKALKDAGAVEQRPLWASTGVKDPKYSDDRYVVDLAAPGCVNTMPEATLNAVRDHGHVHGDSVSATGDEAQRVFNDLVDAGVDLDAVFVELENEGVEKFVEAWDNLIENVKKALA